MEPNSKIHSFLDRVQAKWNRALLIQVAYSVSTVLAGGSLATGLYFYFPTPVLSYGFSGLILVLIGWGLTSTRGFSRINRDQAALLAEIKYPELNNSLINASQLEHHLTDDQGKKTLFSLSFIRKHLQRTQSAIQNLDQEPPYSRPVMDLSRNIVIMFG